MIQFLRKLIPQKIAVKLALVICLLVIGLLSLLGITLNQISARVLKANIQESHQAIAVRAAREISLFIARPVELLKTAGQLLGRTGSSAWDQETLLVELSLEYPFFEEILSLNLKGEEIASSNPGYPKKKYNREKIFREARHGRTSVSSVYISDNYLPHFSVAFPYQFKGEIAGVLMAQVNLRGLWEIVDGIQIGRTGRAFLVTKEGLLVAHPDRRLVLKNTVLPTQEIFHERTWRKNDNLVSYAPVKGPLPLFVGLQIETREAYEFMRPMKFLIWSVIFVSLILSILVSFRLAKMMVQPVRELQAWSRRVAVGDFDFEIPPKSSDELGRLFLRFKQMSRRLKRAREREHLAAIGAAATTISHKFKNSIVALKTFSQLLPERKTDPIFIQRFEKEFSAAIENLEKIFNSLSQIAAPKKSDLEELSLETIFESLRERYAETAGRLGIVFKVETVPYCPGVEGDRDQLYELFENLIQNAIQAMPQGGILLLKSDCNSEISQVRISVRDTGSGIPAHQVHEIFKPFFTTKHGGMGLGLAIAKKIVENHAGNISVISRADKGTLFLVDLPVSQPQKLKNEFQPRNASLV
ncbi:MAG: sensor histidine kinase [Candidatus Omnitrophica bacterium]|nr:sensor histidine kinase [Candidatus Omnitrophota bacterium]